MALGDAAEEATGMLLESPVEARCRAREQPVEGVWPRQEVERRLANGVEPRLSDRSQESRRAVAANLEMPRSHRMPWIRPVEYPDQPRESLAGFDCEIEVTHR